MQEQAARAAELLPLSATHLETLSANGWQVEEQVPLEALTMLGRYCWELSTVWATAVRGGGNRASRIVQRSMHAFSHETPSAFVVERRKLTGGGEREGSEDDGGLSEHS